MRALCHSSLPGLANSLTQQIFWHESLCCQGSELHTNQDRYRLPYCVVLFRFEGNAEEIRNEVHSMQQQVRVLASEKEDLHHHLHSEQQRSRQHHAQVLLSHSLRVHTRCICMVLCQALQG